MWRAGSGEVHHHTCAPWAGCDRRVTPAGRVGTVPLVDRPAEPRAAGCEGVVDEAQAAALVLLAAADPAHGPVNRCLAGAVAPTPAGDSPPVGLDAFW